MNALPLTSDCLLAVESSCDETAIALVDRNGFIHTQELASQIELHRKFGGVVPEVASREHFNVVSDLGRKVMDVAKNRSLQISRVAATMGPGLVGPLLVGSSYAQGLAAGLGIPFIGVHHLRGHLASVLLQEDDGAQPATSLDERARAVFPGLVLLASGGHTQVLVVDQTLEARQLIDTCDDAAGECFDKTAKLMGLPYPGGPEIERLARTIDPADLTHARQISKSLPRPKDREGNFSFSGLKTAIRLKLEADPTLSASPVFCWAVEDAITESLVAGLKRGLERAPPNVKSLVVCGGVAANRRIRDSIEKLAAERNLKLHVPPIRYCTDNAAMIGAAAWLQPLGAHLSHVTARLPLAGQV